MSELKYRISSWDQLSRCKSNNSRDLSIRVEKLIQNDILTGTKISVLHTDFGVLFATVIDANGNLVSEDFKDHVFTLSTEDILSELYKYGFIVYYNEEAHLSSEQIAYLNIVKQLLFDKIRFISVNHKVAGIDTKETMIVVFNIEQNPNWLHNTYSPSWAEYSEALANGSCMNISNVSETYHFRWDWLYGKVMAIQDILDAQEES